MSTINKAKGLSLSIGTVFKGSAESNSSESAKRQSNLSKIRKRAFPSASAEEVSPLHKKHSILTLSPKDFFSKTRKEELLLDNQAIGSPHSSKTNTSPLSVINTSLDATIETLSFQKIWDNEDLDDMPVWDQACNKSGRTSFQTSDDRAFLKGLPFEDIHDYNQKIGADLGKIELQTLIDSPMGLFLSTNGYELVKLLKTDGLNSYCFEIAKTGYPEEPLFLKILKPKNWDAASLKNCLYSEERGIGCLMKHKEWLVDTLVPEHVIVVNKKGGLTTECESGNLILGTISIKIMGANLKNLMETGALKEKDIPNVMIKILEAVNAFKKQHITHRDLNPGNILVNPDALRVWIIDPDHGTKGECKPLDGCYAAPESSSKIDEFTLGLVFLEMCTGIKPFDASIEKTEESVRTIRDEIMVGRIPVIKFSDPFRPYIYIIQGLLKVDPLERWDVGRAIEVLTKLMASSM